MKTNFAIIFLAFLLISSGCTTAYIPNTAHVPIFSNQGELQVRVNGGSSGFDPQISYAVTDHFGVMLNGSFRDDIDNETNPQKHNIGELGIGYYNNTNGQFVYEIFTGYGYGGVQSTFFTELSSDVVTATYNRAFIQPAAGLVTDVFDIAVGGRFSYLNMTPEEAFITTLPTEAFYFEPSLTVGIGYRYVKFNLQFLASVPLMENTNLAYESSPFCLSFGLATRIGRKYF